MRMIPGRLVSGRGWVVAQLGLGLSLLLSGVFTGAGCSRDTLIGIDVPPFGSGGTVGIGSGGTWGPGSGGTIGIGSGGSIGVGSGGTIGTEASCAYVSLSPGALNPCREATAAAFSPDGKLLATATRNSGGPNVHVWRVSDGKLLYEVPQTNNPVYNVTFSPDSKFLVAGGVAPLLGGGTGQSNAAAVFEAITGALVATLPTHSGPYVSAVAFSHDGTHLITAGQQSFIDVWGVEKWSDVMAIPTTSPESIYEVDFSPDDSRFITSGSSGVNRIRRTSDGAEVAQITNVFDEMNRATYSPNGQLILSDAGAGQLQLLDADAKVLQVVTFKPTSDLNPIGYAAWIDDSHFVADDWYGHVAEWAKDPAQPQGSFSLVNSWMFPGQALGIAVALDRQSFVVTGAFGFAVLAP